MFDALSTTRLAIDAALLALASDFQAFCGGPGSGRPGPCPDPGRPHSRYRPRGGRTRGGAHKEGASSPVLPRHAGTGRAVPTKATWDARPAATRRAKDGAKATNKAKAVKGQKFPAGSAEAVHARMEAVGKAAEKTYAAFEAAHTRNHMLQSDFAKHWDKKGALKGQKALGDWTVKAKELEGKLDQSVREFDRAKAAHRTAVAARQGEFVKAMAEGGKAPSTVTSAALKPDASVKDTAAIEKSIKDGSEFVAKVAHGADLKFTPSVGPATVVGADGKETGTRAYWRDSEKLMRLSETDGPNTVAHELGHALEYSNPGVQKAANDFLKARVGDEAPTNLREKFGDFYDPGEVGRKDNFDKAFPGGHAYYVGKVYKGGATEVVAMGLQALHEDAARFAAKDPEYFKFMVNVLKGKFHQ